MGHESGTRIEEHPDEDGYHHKRDDIDMQDVVADHERSDDDKEDDQRVEHGYGPELLEIVLAEKREVNGQTDDEDGHVEYLSHDRDTDLLVGLLATLQLLLVGQEDVVGLVVNNISSVDDLLPALGNAACQGNTVGEVAQAGFAALLA